ncbi:MAG: hypothetical protein ACLFVT_02565, partial [Syntrophobacteria bacterium]
MKRSIRLQDVYKTFTHYQDKARSPDETVFQVRHRFAEVDLEILQETMRIDSGRLDIPVYI